MGKIFSTSSSSSSGGNVVGPGSSTTNALAAYANTSGQLLENTGISYVASQTNGSGLPGLTCAGGFVASGSAGSFGQVVSNSLNFDASGTANYTLVTASGGATDSTGVIQQSGGSWGFISGDLGVNQLQIYATHDSKSVWIGTLDGSASAFVALTIGFATVLRVKSAEIDVAQNIYPTTNGTLDIGSPTFHFNSVFSKQLYGYTVFVDNTNAPVAFSGTATLVAGTVTVANTNIVTTGAVKSLVFVSNNGASGTVGALSVVLTNGVGFTINSTSVLDTSTIAWWIVQRV